MFIYENWIYYNPNKDFINEIARHVESCEAIDRIDLDLEDEIETHLGETESVSIESEEIDAPQLEFEDLFEFKDEDLELEI